MSIPTIHIIIEQNYWLSKCRKLIFLEKSLYLVNIAEIINV